MPYIGYGHCLLPGETLTENLSKAQADSLLRSDLRKCCDAFREFENDALLLGVLSYNVGIFRLKGHGRIPKSRLIRKLEKGERDIYEEYVSFRCYKGKVIEVIYIKNRYIEPSGEYAGRKVFEGVEEDTSPYMGMNLHDIFDSLRNFRVKYWNI